MQTICGSRVSSFRGAQSGLKRSVPVSRGATAMVMAKKGIHPEWFPEAKVICNGAEVMTLGGTKPEYNVDIYSGNHPFYQGQKSFLILDEGQLNKFRKRFAGLDELSDVQGANKQ